MDRGAGWVLVHGITKSRTRLSDYHSHFSGHLNITGLTEALRHPDIYCYQIVQVIQPQIFSAVKK